MEISALSSNGNCWYTDAIILGNSLLRQAGLGIRKVQTPGEILKALQAKCEDRGEVAGRSYGKFPLQSLMKIK